MGWDRISGVQGGCLQRETLRHARVRMGEGPERGGVKVISYGNEGSYTSTGLRDGWGGKVQGGGRM